MSMRAHIVIAIFMDVHTTWLIKNKSLGSRSLFISMFCNFPEHIKFLFEGGYDASDSKDFHSL